MNQKKEESGGKDWKDVSSNPVYHLSMKSKNYFLRTVVQHGMSIPIYVVMRTTFKKSSPTDLDANTWFDGISVDFMIECKYKTRPTKWIFLPHPYSHPNELSRNSFLHPSDHSA